MQRRPFAGLLPPGPLSDLESIMVNSRRSPGPVKRRLRFVMLHLRKTARDAANEALESRSSATSWCLVYDRMY